MRQMTSALESHSPLQQPILHITITVMAILFAILVLVAVLLVIASVKYRQRASGREPHQNFGNAKLEITWTALPFLLLVAIFVLTVIAMRAADPPTAMSGGDDPPPDIVVVGHQFWWEFRYAEGFVAANEMHVPVGRRLLLRIEAADVIHDFWVPALGRKMDAIPGSPNQMYFEAGEPGEYGGTCAEFCGAEHAWMRLLVIAQPQKEYEAWVREQQAKPASPTEGDALRGKQIFGTTSCATCHAVSGVTSARVGPDLTHLASRQTLAAGRMPNNPANLEAWLRNPEKFKPGSYMPNALLSQQDLTALVAYLETLR